MKKVNALVLGLSVLLAFGCGDKKKQDPTPESNATAKCKLTNRTTSVAGINYFTDFIYDSSGKLTRVNSSYPANQGGNSYVLITYNANGQIAKTIDYDKNNVPRYHRVFSYNANGQPDTITNFNGNLNTFTTYEYNKDKQLVRSSVFSPYDSLSLNYSEFTYPGANQSKEIRYRRNANGTAYQDDTFENLYDNKRHPHSELGYFFEALLFSQHNLLTRTITNNGQYVNDQTYTYEYNLEGYPVKQTMTPGRIGSKTIDTFTYNCQ